MRKTLVRSFVLLALAACGAAGEDDDGSGDALQVALLTSGPVSDAGWNAAGYEGLMLLEDSLGAEISHQQTRTPAEYDEAFLAYGSSGYDLVFAHGFEYQDAALRAGARFPEMTIVVSGGGRIAENVVPLIFRLEQASYLAGMVAATLSESGVVGMVGGVEIPPVQGTFRAFEAGALAVDPDVRVLESFIGNWDDVAAAKEAAVAQLGRGADVLIHNVDAASFGVFQAVREVVESGGRAWALGMNSDQNHVAPDVIVGSAVIRVPRAFLETARRWQAGVLGGAPIYTGTEEQVVDFVFNPARSDQIPADLRAAVEGAREDIRSGALEVPRVPFVEGEGEREGEGEPGASSP